MHLHVQLRRFVGAQFPMAGQQHASRRQAGLKFVGDLGNGPGVKAEVTVRPILSVQPPLLPGLAWVAQTADALAPTSCPGGGWRRLYGGRPQERSRSRSQTAPQGRGDS